MEEKFLFAGDEKGASSDQSRESKEIFLENRLLFDLIKYACSQTSDQSGPANCMPLTFLGKCLRLVARSIAHYCSFTLGRLHAGLIHNIPPSYLICLSPSHNTGEQRCAEQRFHPDPSFLYVLFCKFGSMERLNV